MWLTACSTDFDPGRPSRPAGAAGGGRGRATPNSTATKNPFAATSTKARMTPPAVMRPGLPARDPASPVRPSDRGLGGLGVRQLRGDVRRVLAGARDQLVARLAVILRQEAGLHPEVHGLRVVGDDRDRRLLGLDRVPAAQAQADRRR